ncbi:MAG: beta-N-acetylhexosaminidase, partial [bacterium]
MLERTKKKIFYLVLSIFLFQLQSFGANAENILIIPEPRHIEFTGRWFNFDGFRNLPDFLMKEFNIKKGSWTIKRLGGDSQNTKVLIRDREIQFWGNKYTAYATLIQLINRYKDKLPEATVDESFHFRFRGYHLDIARGGIPNLATFKKILRTLFLLKYNYFAIYLEDLFPWKKYPEIGRYRGRLTEEELKEILAYGKRLGIEVFPSLELTGHMENILTLPQFRRFSEWHSPQEGCLDLSSKEAREFSYELLKEVLAFFPSKYVHIGGDETWALGRGKSLDKSWRFEGPSLYEEQYRNLIEISRGYGKEPIVWGDMISGMYLNKEEKDKWKLVLESKIWDDVVIANWDYSASSKEFFKDRIDLFGKRKNKEIACPGLANWNTYYPNFDIALENMKNFLTAAKEENLFGFLITAWGDDGEECLFSFLDPLILASMEIAEGNGNWEEKWLSFSGEDKSVLKARELFGRRDISSYLKHILFADQWYYDPKNKDKIVGLKTRYKEVLNGTDGIRLPKDLVFMRNILKVATKRLDGSIKGSDLIGVSKEYASLWLSERKP